jgi:hypothetical protein
LICGNFSPKSLPAGFWPVAHRLTCIHVKINYCFITIHYEIFSLLKISRGKNITLVDIKQFASKMDSLGCQLSKEKYPEETIQEYL